MVVSLEEITSKFAELDQFAPPEPVEGKVLKSLEGLMEVFAFIHNKGLAGKNQEKLRSVERGIREILGTPEGRGGITALTEFLAAAREDAWNVQELNTDLLFEGERAGRAGYEGLRTVTDVLLNDSAGDVKAMIADGVSLE